MIEIKFLSAEAFKIKTGGAFRSAGRYCLSFTLVELLSHH
jgi:hypothetical protein